MGRTVLSFRQALNREIGTWSEFRRGLAPGDRERFDALMDMSRHRADAASLAARPVLSEAMFMSIITGLMERMDSLSSRLSALEAKVDSLNAGGRQSG
ncbi:hypothetical protein GF325_17850 [Candidatus Bathyarchaeota archaeon]|nr:hypothetical protein [Candidatus Bathyarchaeota archaeon]